MSNLCMKARHLWNVSESYVEGMDIWDVALLKCCLCAFGVIIGLCLPRRWKRPALLVAAGVFLITYLPLIYRLVRLICPACRGDRCEDV